MMKLFFSIFLILFGCAHEKKPPLAQYELSGIVRLHKEAKKDAKVELQVCKGMKWYEDEKNWVKTTDDFGRYKIIISSYWFGCYYKIRASATDQYGRYYRSEWYYDVVKFANETKDIWLGEIGELEGFVEEKETRKVARRTARARARRKR